MNATALLEALFNGLSLSSILILTAVGLAITFGVMRVINMAHGEMLMLGAYAGYFLTDPQALPVMVRSVGRLLGRNFHTDYGFHFNFFWAIPFAFLVVALVGYLLETCLIRFLYGRPLDTLLATWGVGLILQQVVRLLFEADLKPISTPALLQGSWEPLHGRVAGELAGVTFGYYRMFVIGVTALCLLGVYLLFHKTSFGLKVRAVTQNRAMASALGISTRRVDSLTFALGAGLAGVAGCILGAMYQVKPDMGTDYVVDAFMVVILGGVGQLTGTVAGGAVIGTGNSLAAKGLDNEPMAKVVILMLVIAFIQFRPAGLFTTRERVYD